MVKNLFAARLRSLKTAVGRVVLLPIAATVLFLVGGCGGGDELPRAAVEGNVEVGGEPLAAGVIRFVPLPPTHGPAVVATIRDGRFELARRYGPVLGNHRVEIDAGIDDDPAGGADDPEEARLEYARQNGRWLPVALIPDAYNRNSTLEVEVTADGDNTFDFELSAP